MAADHADPRADEPGLPGSPIDGAFRDGRRQRLRPGAVLFSEGDVSNRVVLLLSGRVKVSSFSDEGQETILGFRGPGEVLGELSAIDGEDHLATVTVVEPGEALIVPAARFVAALSGGTGPVARAAALRRRQAAGRGSQAGGVRRPRTWPAGWPTGWWSWPGPTASPFGRDPSASRSRSGSSPAGWGRRARP